VRHNFVNDIGDYAKYALLRALADNGEVPVRLGVIWYLTDHAEQTSNGRRRAHLTHAGWDSLDPDLLATMRLIESSVPDASGLSIRLIENSDILPPGTVYFSEALPSRQGNTRQRVADRVAWFERARSAVEHCDLVFLDPDNGLEVASVPLSSPMAVKYASFFELNQLLDAHGAVVVYQHGDRTPWPAQRAKVIRQVTAAAERPLKIRSLRLGAFGARAFFCITDRPELARVVDVALLRLGQRAAGWDKGAYLLLE